MLEKIKRKLETVDPSIYYGMVDEIEDGMLWNYIVFNRTKFQTTGNKTGYADGIDVHIVRENFIPEGIDLEIINKMQEIDGIRFANEDGTYNYVRKPNTNTVVEMLTLHFMRARKC